MGKNTLSDIMKSICADAGTSKTYTDHCLRAFTVSRLNAESVPERHIMAITGHKNAQSLTRYCRPTEEQERHMAALLDGDAGQQPSTSTALVPSSQFGRDVLDLLGDLPPQASVPSPSPAAAPICSQVATTGVATSAVAFSGQQPPQASFDDGHVDVDELLGGLSPSELLALEAPPTPSATTEQRNALLHFGSGNNFSGAVFNLNLTLK